MAYRVGVSSAPPAILGNQARRWVSLAVLLAGSFMALADFFVVNVALPSIGSSLRAGPDMLEGVVAGYGVAYAVGLVPGGRLGDNYGRKAVFRLGLGGFVIASAACAVAPDAVALVASRVAQGLFASLIVPQVLASIRVGFTGAGRRLAFGIYGASLGLAMAAGQVLGGAVVSANLFGAAWRPAFWINVPIGLAALVVSGAAVEESRAPRVKRVDLAGSALLAGATGMGGFVVIEGPVLGWPAWAVAAGAGAVALVVAFIIFEVRLERRGGYPIIPPVLLRARTFLTGLGVAAFFFQIPGGFFFALALYLQGDLHLSPAAAGVATLPFAGGFLAGSPLAAALARRYGKALLQGGLVGMLAGIWVVSRGAGGGGIGWIEVGLGVWGFSQALVSTPLFGVVLSSLEASEAGAAAGILTTVQQLAFAAGVVVVGLMMFGGTHPGTLGRVGGGPGGMQGALEACAALDVAAVALVALMPGRAIEAP